MRRFSYNMLQSDDAIFQKCPPEILAKKCVVALLGDCILMLIFSSRFSLLE